MLQVYSIIQTCVYSLNILSKCTTFSNKTCHNVPRSQTKHCQNVPRSRIKHCHNVPLSRTKHCQNVTSSRTKHCQTCIQYLDENDQKLRNNIVILLFVTLQSTLNLQRKLLTCVLRRLNIEQQESY